MTLTLSITADRVGIWPRTATPCSPLLSRMRRDGLLDYDWRESTAGPPRKYYRLTPAGQQQLTAFKAYWASLTSLIEELGR